MSAAKKRGLPNTALEAFVPEKSKAKKAAAKPERVAKRRYTIHVSTELFDRARNAAYWLPGVTVSGLVEAGVLREVERLEKANGGPFERRAKELVGGRPIGK